MASPGSSRIVSWRTCVHSTFKIAFLVLLSADYKMADSAVTKQGLNQHISEQDFIVYQRIL